ncbi:hypothetical protein Tco_0867670 [Tanacetum coccineum]
MGDTISQTRSESVSKLSNDPLLARGNTLRSDEDKLKLEEFMALCTTLQSRVLDLETTKTTQANEIASLKIRVKKLERGHRSRTYKLKRLYKVGLTARVESFREEKVWLVRMYLLQTEVGKEVFVAEQNEEVVDAAQVKTAIITTEDVTLAQALVALKTLKPKAKGIVIQDPEPEKPLKKKDQISFDEETAKRLQAEFDEEERLLAKRLQAEEQEQFTIEQKATLFKELLEQRRKHFTAKRAEEKRNKPPTKNQQKKTMITYLKNMEGWKHKDLKSKDFDSIKELFDKALKRVNMFVDFRTELVEDSSKRASIELEQEVTKKQKVDDVQDTAESPSIVDWKIYKEGKKSYYQIIRADGSSKMIRSTRPEEDYERVLWGDLKTMFEPHVEDTVWRNQQDYRVLD